MTLLEAAKNLRAAQRAYMEDRGNDSLGVAVAVAARELDAAIIKAEGIAAENAQSSNERPEGTPLSNQENLSQ